MLLKGFGDSSVRHVRRSCNGVAHRLAKEGCENKTCNSWVGSPPNWVVNCLASDIAGKWSATFKSQKKLATLPFLMAHRAAIYFVP